MTSEDAGAATGQPDEDNLWSAQPELSSSLTFLDLLACTRTSSRQQVCTRPGMI